MVLTKHFEYLSELEVEEIHEASINILENLGVKIDDSKLRNSLYHIGAEVNGNRVKFKKDLVEKVLGGIVKEITFQGRNGKRVDVKPGHVVSHSSGGIPSIIDMDTQKRRKADLDDFIKALRVMDNLDYLDMPCALFYPDNVPGEISQIRQFEHMLKYTTKPIYGPGVSSPGEAKYIIELYKLFSNEKSSVKNEYLGLLGISSESPLYFPKEITDTMNSIIKEGIPVVMLAAPVAGISSPYTLAGGIAQMNAEILAFTVIAYSINPKAPLIYGARLNYPNMKNGLSIWGLPEIGISNAVVAQLARSYGFLTDVYGFSCTSCAFDNQIGYEKAINGLLPVIAGANMISGFGSMASLMVASFEQLVIDNETFAMLKKVQKGIKVNRDTLALEVISRVIEKEDTFLTQEHTIKYLRDGEIFIPKLGFDNSWNEWEALGQKDIRLKAKETVQEILKNDCLEPLPREIDREINKIVDKAQQELVLNK